MLSLLECSLTPGRALQPADKAAEQPAAPLSATGGAAASAWPSLGDTAERRRKGSAAPPVPVSAQVQLHLMHTCLMMLILLSSVNLLRTAHDSHVPGLSDPPVLCSRARKLQPSPLQQPRSLPLRAPPSRLPQL